MRNIFVQDTYQAGLGLSSGSGFRPIRMGEATFGMLPGMSGAAAAIPESKNRRPEIPHPPRRDGALRISENRFQWAVGRLCSIMRKFSTTDVSEEIQGQIFWSYVRHAKSSEESVLTAYKTVCPELPVPAKPVSPEKELLEEGKNVFRGKTSISYDEARQLMLSLDEVLRPLTPEEAASSIGKQECLRDFAAGNFPKVEELKDSLEAFIEAGDTAATFEISKGDIVVAGKAIDCAVALGRGKAIKAALTAGGVIGAGALLLFLI